MVNTAESQTAAGFFSLNEISVEKLSNQAKESIVFSLVLSQMLLIIFSKD